VPQPTLDVTWTRTVLAHGGARTDRPAALTRSVVRRFVAGSLVAVLVLVVAGALVGEQVAQHEVLRGAERFSQLIAHTVVEPNLDEGLVAGDAASLAAFDGLVQGRLIPGTAVRRVKIWDAHGRVLYSDDPAQVGRVFAMEGDQRAALRSGHTTGRVSDLSDSESSAERLLEPRLVEVYTPVTGPGGEPLLFEVYLSYAMVHEQRTTAFRLLGYFALAGLVVFVAFQVAMAAANLRWLQRRREDFAERTRSAAEDERRRVARDLHDGVVQDLVAASLIVSAAVDELQASGRGEAAESVRRAVRSLRASVQSLRSLLVQIYPSGLSDRGLVMTLTELVEPLRTQGMHVELELPGSVDLPDPVQMAVFRAAQEALRNVTRHAGATSVTVALRLGERTVELLVRDDGSGLDVLAEGSPAGHLGLRSLADLAAERGGVLEIATAPGQGTEIRLELPR
jgi:signal transduction histidine kinase